MLIGAVPSTVCCRTTAKSGARHRIDWREPSQLLNISPPFGGDASGVCTKSYLGVNHCSLGREPTLFICPGGRCRGGHISIDGVSPGLELES